MQIREAPVDAESGETAYAAFASLAMVEEAYLTMELNSLRAALINWTAARGLSAKSILLTLVGPIGRNAAAKRETLAAFEADPDLASIARHCDVRVYLLNNGETPTEEFPVTG